MYELYMYFARGHSIHNRVHGLYCASQPHSLIERKTKSIGRILKQKLNFINCANACRNCIWKQMERYEKKL